MGLYVRQNSLQFKTLVSIASPDDDQWDGRIMHWSLINSWTCLHS
jgi:hypothetical protein